jgi:hypothetical protein
MRESGANIMHVQDAFGHDLAETTMVYLHGRNKAARKANVYWQTGEARVTSEVKIMDGGK